MSLVVCCFVACCVVAAVASSLLSVVYLTCRMRVGLQVVIGKLIALTASVAAGALAVKDILRDVMKVICQAGVPVPQVLDNLF